MGGHGVSCMYRYVITDHTCQYTQISRGMVCHSIDISQPNPILIEIQYEDTGGPNGKAGTKATNLVAKKYLFNPGNSFCGFILFSVFFTYLYTSVHYAVCSVCARYNNTLSVTS
jgi:hypothetical protein